MNSTTRRIENVRRASLTEQNRNTNTDKKEKEKKSLIERAIYGASSLIQSLAIAAPGHCWHLKDINNQEKKGGENNMNWYKLVRKSNDNEDLLRQANTIDVEMRMTPNPHVPPSIALKNTPDPRQSHWESARDGSTMD